MPPSLTFAVAKPQLPPKSYCSHPLLAVACAQLGGINAADIKKLKEAYVANTSVFLALVARRSIQRDLAPVFDCAQEHSNG
jgi:hypothetical protein